MTWAVGDGRRRGPGRHPPGLVGAVERTRQPVAGDGIADRKGLGVSMDTLMRMQNSFDIAAIREVEPYVGKSAA
jgi:hypothetical protein